MKRKIPILVCVGLFLGLIVLGIGLTRTSEHDPKDLGYWMRAGAGKDWSAQAAQGVPEAQFQLGLTLVKTNLVTMISRVRWLSSIPLIGKRHFTKTTYAINPKMSAEQLAEAHGWIRKAAEQGYGPAQEAEKLLFGAPQNLPPVVGWSGTGMITPLVPVPLPKERSLTEDGTTSAVEMPARADATALTTAEATELAEKLANDRAEALYQCRPFFNTSPALPFGTGWSWQVRCGYRLVDFEARVTFDRYGSHPDVSIAVLDSRAQSPPVERLR